jgi:hypothetical protein
MIAGHKKAQVSADITRVSSNIALQIDSIRIQWNESLIYFTKNQAFTYIIHWLTLKITFNFLSNLT